MTVREYVDTLNGAPEDAALIYKTEVRMICKLPTAEERDEAFRLLLLQGMSQEQVESENIAIEMLLTGTFASQISRRQRHDQAIENGQKGGRPETIDREKVIELRKRGLTQKQISDEMKCHINSVRNILREAKDKQKPTITNNNTDNIGSNSDIVSAYNYDRPANDHPYVGETYGQGAPDDDGDLPF